MPERFAVDPQFDLHAHLDSFGAFDDDVIQTVTTGAEKRDRKTWSELADAYGLDHSRGVFETEGRPYNVVHLLPKGDFDEHSATIFHLPYANDISAVSDTWVAHILSYMEAVPGEQTIAVGSASFLGSRRNTLALRDCLKVARDADLSPAVTPTLRYVESTGVSTVKHIGQSQGGNKAVAAAKLGPEYGIRSESMVAIDPSGIKETKFIKLAMTLLASRGNQERSIQNSNSAPYFEVWNQDNLLTALRFLGGMARLSNLAVGAAFRHPIFETDAVAALEATKKSKIGTTSTLNQLALYWSSREDEFNFGDEMTALSDRLEDAYGDRVKGRAVNMSHSDVDDINLFNALTLQGLKCEETA